MYKKLTIFFLLFPLITHAATVESLIKQADKLNDQCRGGSGDNPATIKACDKRDKLIDEINAKGWCYGHEGQAGYQRKWEKCHTASETVTPAETATSDPLAGRGGGWFRSAHGILLRNQLDNCENFKAAGNPSLYKSCRTRTLNAHDYLLDRANNSKLPQAGWSFCSDQIQYDFPSGAQCLAAVELLCPPDENKEFADFNQCYKVMTSGAWVSNPTIQRMTFTAPAR